MLQLMLKPQTAQWQQWIMSQGMSLWQQQSLAAISCWKAVANTKPDSSDTTGHLVAKAADTGGQRHLLSHGRASV